MTMTITPHAAPCGASVQGIEREVEFEPAQ